MTQLVDLLKHQTSSIEEISNIVKKSLNIDNMFNNPGDTIGDYDIDDKKIPMNDVNEYAIKSVNNIIHTNSLYTSINSINVIYINMICNHQFMIKTNTVVEYLKNLRNITTHMVLKPKEFNLSKYKEENIDKIISEIL